MNHNVSSKLNIFSLVLRALYPVVQLLFIGLSILLLPGFENPSYAAATIKINPKATYLHTNNDAGAINSIPIELSSIGLAAGDTILLEHLGDYSQGPNADIVTSMLAVFSSSATLTSATNLHRVSGAIDAGVDAITENTYFGSQPTDIPEDFRIMDSGTLITIPTGALYLFVTASDSYYQDNTDPDGDYNVRISFAPLAKAGLDQTINEGNQVTLDGSGSKGDPSRALNYHWQQVAGTPTVSLDLSDPIHPIFIAPNVPRSGATLTFQLVINDGFSDSKPDTVDITIKDINHLPIAEAGVDQTVQEESLVILNGSNSYDPDNDVLTFNWVQTAGSIVTLDNASTPQPSFISPIVNSAGETLMFQLIVSDGIASNMDTVSVRVDNVNHAPIANAGNDQTINEGGTVILSGLNSIDPDNDLLTFAWTKLSGPEITIADPATPTPSFTTPQVDAGGADIEFELLVSDGLLDSSDKVVVHVMDKNDPPVCELAAASSTTLWPPNKKMIPVDIINISDPDNDQVTINIVSVTQDESTDGLGSGDPRPDAIIQDQGMLLRAERAGGGNGRVYKINFIARDFSGKNCAGTVNVCVPNNPNPGHCIDDGQQYLSYQQ